MNKNLLFILAFILLSAPGFSNEFDVFWKPLNTDQITTAGTRYLFPSDFATYTLNTSLLNNSLANLPEDPQKAVIIALPMPGKNFKHFRVWQTPIMERSLAARYPAIKTFTAVAVDNHMITAKLDMTLKGFHAMVYDGTNTYFIDPYSNVNDDNYICYYKRDYNRTAMPAMSCASIEEPVEALSGNRIVLPGNTPGSDVVNGVTKLTYRLALACTAEYAVAVDGPTPTKPGVLSAMVTSINRVSGVYERELSVSLQLISNNDDLIYLANPDPYSNGSGSTMQTENQNNIDVLIGTANYDIGHVFSTGGGGIASFQSVCKSASKARGVTGQANPVGDPFDIDYVAHEMGHQFGGSHTFNASTGSCSGNAVNNSAYEPGSGTTIMAYAGICSSNNTQAHSDAYFHMRSLEQIISYLGGIGGSCAATSLTGNTPPVIPPFQQSYNIPFLTPFELIAPEAIDLEHDTLTYCWEQWNRGDFGQSFINTRMNGPIFRSFNPDTSRTRVFTTLDKLLTNVTNYLGEKLADTARGLTFRLTVRDIYNGTGSVNTSDDSISLNVVYTGTPFKVTYPDMATTLLGGTNINVTWDVSSTDQAPINCSTVDIFLSEDGGYTYPHILATATPNDGNEIVTVPAINTTKARLKIKGTGNVFFDLSNQNSVIVSWALNTSNLAAADNINIYPVPASDKLNIVTGVNETANLVITNTLGQKIFENSFSNKTSVDVKNWNRGIYYITIQEKNNSKIVRSVLVQ